MSLIFSLLSFDFSNNYITRVCEEEMKGLISFILMFVVRTNCCNAKRNLACDAIWIPFVNLGEFRVSLFRKKNITPSLILNQESLYSRLYVYIYRLYIDSILRMYK